MPTETLFRSDAHLKEAEAVVVSASADGIELDRTLFYARGGGQPGDRGWLIRADGTRIPIVDAVCGPDRSIILHKTTEGASLPGSGESVRMVLDWSIRHPRMRIHTALHLLSVVLPHPVTGGSVGDGDGRLDFDWPEADKDKETIAAELNAMIARNAAVTERWITDEELAANPSLVKTMSVKPPMGAGRVRLVAIEGLDLQPCGGTHTRSTGEIGPVVVTGVEKKGKINRRVKIALA